MKTMESQNARYLREPPPARMGNLASDFMRLSSWVRGRWKDDRIVDLMDQIAWMIEQNPEFASEELANMQREICRWRRIWPLEPARALLAFRARCMSDRILELSGLLEQESPDTLTAATSGRKDV